MSIRKIARIAGQPHNDRFVQLALGCQIFTTIDIISFPSLHGLRRYPKKSTKPKHKNVQKLQNHNNACVVIRRYVGEERSKATQIMP
jgi:hypothetical protein